MLQTNRRLLPVGLSLLLAACAAPAPTVDEAIRSTASEVDDARLERAADDVGNWLSHGQTYAEDRFSRLDQISTRNVAELGLAWSFDTGMRGGMEATPLVVDGTMYLTGPWSIVYALDARTGSLRWMRDPEVPRLHGLKACCDVVNRGLAFYRGKVYVGTLDGRLVALDAATGETVWVVATFDPSTNYTITGAPRVVQGKVIIGNGGAEYGVRGFVTAYDAETGAQAWRTYTVPGDPSKGFESEALRTAAASWSGEWWTAGGGGTAWDAIVYDPELDLLYVGTGNGSPWSRNMRSPGGGDNLYLSSILALDPADGSYVWHYQTTPGDNWDFTATQPLILADLEIEGRPRKVIMQAPKNGFFYVIDRQTGAFISAEPYVPVTWAEGIDETGRPIERPSAAYSSELSDIQPAAIGAHNWQPMAFNHETGYVYLPVQVNSNRLADDTNWTYSPEGWNLAIRYGEGAVEQTGALLAWDPVAQREVWRIPLAHRWNGGTLTSAGGLVFQGGGDGRFVAYDALNGDVLWESSTGLGIIAAPMSYRVAGDQYVAVAAGWGGATGRSGAPTGEAALYRQTGRVMAFKIGGTATAPALARRPDAAFVPELDLDASSAAISRGKGLFEWRCQSCHGARGASEGAMPNLQEANQSTHDAFEQIVIGGILEPRGMPSFEGLLTPEEVGFIQAYIISEAKATRAAPAP